MTTRRQFAVNTLAAFLVAGTLFGQQFWEKKQYPTWTSEEITMLTTNSPWAKELKTTVGGQEVKLMITWLTAMPIKQAILKERMDEGGVLADSAKEIMEGKEDYYAIGVTGIPKELARQLTEAWLKIPGKPDIQPAKGDFQDRGRTVDLMILFSNATPIAAADKEVEVALKLSGTDITKKFPLNEMMFNGKLEL
jgi:hypothetical protein